MKTTITQKVDAARVELSRLTKRNDELGQFVAADELRAKEKKAEADKQEYAYIKVCEKVKKEEGKVSEKHEEHLSIETAIADLRVDMQPLVVEKEKMEAVIATLSSKVENTRSELSDTISSVESKHNELVVLKGKIKNSKTDLESIETQCGLKDIEAKELEGSIKEHSKSLSKKKKALKELGDTFEELSTSTKKEIGSLTGELEKIKSKLVQARGVAVAAVSDLEVQVKTLKDSIEEKQAEFSEIEAKSINTLLEFQDEKAQIEGDIENLKNVQKNLEAKKAKEGLYATT